MQERIQENPMAALKTCPACKKQIDEKATQCPECKKQLEILYWEIEQTTGEKVLYQDGEAKTSIRDQLLSGQMKLTDRCRQYLHALKSVEDGIDNYSVKNDLGWKTLRDYADKVFDLQVLYNPAMAYGKSTAQTTWVIVGFLVAIGWNADILIAAGANLIVAIVFSLVLLLLTPTVLGLGIASFILAGMYQLPAMGMAIRTFFAILIGALVGAAVGWTFGFAIGALIGLTKKKALSV
jgi:hypothetical protein